MVLSTCHFRWLPSSNAFCTSLFLCSLMCCFAKDDITPLERIRDGNSETLISAGRKFELGFFDPNEEDQNLASSGSPRRYVGIWYYTTRTVVWVANRDSPINDSSGEFAVRSGNIHVFDSEGKSRWSTGLEETTSAWTARLLNSGNLVFIDDTSGRIIWESFQNPTNTFLPGMKMNKNLNLTSWKSQNDPGIGNFIFQTYQQNQYVIRKGSVPYWVSATPGMYLSYNQMPEKITAMLSNFSRGSGSRYNVPNPLPNENNFLLVMSYDGFINFTDSNGSDSNPMWRAPEDKCSVYNACGNFGSCNNESELLCRCLPGFMPSSPGKWDSGDFSGGCERKSLCGKPSEEITFLSLKMMKIGTPKDVLIAKNESECRSDCLQDCECLAYSYSSGGKRNRGAPSCWIWRLDLLDLQELYADAISNLNVRVAQSDIEPTPRSCKPCGTNLIPYPLSTGADCGDPSYSNFNCSNETGQLRFHTASAALPVLIINAMNGTIIVSENKSCGASDNTLQLDSPFKVSNSCYHLDGISGTAVEIVWDRPSEPLCAQSSDCQDWPNSSCLASKNGTKRCLCNKNFQWNNVTINCIPVSTGPQEPSPGPQEPSPGPQEPSPGPHEGRSNVKRWVSSPKIYGPVTAIVIAFVLSCTFVFCIYKRKRRLANREAVRRDQSVQLYDSEVRAKRMIESSDFSEKDKKMIEVPFFELDSILAATNNFSDDNKLGQGGFGPVYKGIFSGNRQIAIKKLSSISGQGLDEFKNEVVLISKLQHRNLVRLVGYCVTREEKMLLYEYMPNRSLDYFIFDRALCTQLNWDVRFDIIMGIARGLLYLHEDSRLKIIHRDMKLSNILLDEEMNPKISDFGLARIFRSKQTEAVTLRVVGTYGYMSPEYALEGFFSVKSDVYSFGVMVLEIISGRRNTGFYKDKNQSLLGFTWKLWTEASAMDLMDPVLRDSCKIEEYMKCLQTGLLCVQEDPNDRPTVSTVVHMLGSEIASLPAPKQPAFVLARGIEPGTASSSNRPDSESSNMLTHTVLSGR